MGFWLCVLKLYTAFAVDHAVPLVPHHLAAAVATQQ
jgi:hypothetical protein